MAKRYTTVKLTGYEAAALRVVAEAEGITPEHLLEDLIRDAAILHVNGKRRRASSVEVIRDAQGEGKA